MSKRPAAPPPLESPRRPRLLTAISTDDAAAILELLNEEPELLAGDARKMQLVEVGVQAKALQVLKLFAETAFLPEQDVARLLSFRNPEWALLLLQAGFNPNARDEDGRSALHLAVFNQAPDVVRTLLQAGANADVSDSWRITAHAEASQLLYAARQKEQIYPADRAAVANLQTIVTLLQTSLVDRALCGDKDVTESGARVERTSPQGSIAPARVRFFEGWLLHYNQATTDAGDPGERDFERVCELIRRERSQPSSAGRHGYDVVLAHVKEGLLSFPTLAVTTDDPGSRDENRVLSMLFQHNNPSMSGSVESFAPAQLQQLLRDCERSKSVNFERLE